HNNEIIYINHKTGVLFGRALLLFKAEKYFRIQRSGLGLGEDDFLLRMWRFFKEPGLKLK
ncbi:MAG: hypothetical protein ACK583_14910, partial [Cyanobacteriota bacterium]